MDTSAVPTWAVVVPVKRADVAKSRLSGALEPWRTGLARAFAADTIAAVLASRRVEEVIVVTDLGSATASGFVDGGSVRLVDDPSRGQDMNVAVAAGLDVAATRARVAVVAADLPALRTAELDAALAAAGAHPYAVVGDVERVGTTLLGAVWPARVRPAYGGASFARHRADGAVGLEGEQWPTLRRDVDVPAHIEQVRALGPGPRTTVVLQQIDAQIA